MYTLVIALVPPGDHAEPPLPLLTRARLLLYPYIRREEPEHDEDGEGEDGVSRRRGRWDDAIVGRRDVFRGCLWLDRYGRLPPEHPVADAEDEPRLAAEVNLRNAFLAPEAVITPDGQVHSAGRHTTAADIAMMEDLIASHASCVAVPFSCHW